MNRIKISTASLATGLFKALLNIHDSDKISKQTRIIKSETKKLSSAITETARVIITLSCSANITATFNIFYHFVIGHSSNPFVFLGVQNLQQTQIIG